MRAKSSQLKSLAKSNKLNLLLQGSVKVGFVRSKGFRLFTAILLLVYLITTIVSLWVIGFVSIVLVSVAAGYGLIETPIHNGYLFDNYEWLFWLLSISLGYYTYIKLNKRYGINVRYRVDDLALFNNVAEKWSYSEIIRVEEVNGVFSIYFKNTQSINFRCFDNLNPSELLEFFKSKTNQSTD